IGIMLGSFAGAMVNVVQSYANPNSIKAFMMWSFGSLQNISYQQLGLLIIPVALGLIVSFFLIKPLNLLLLGEKNAALLGVSVKQVRLLVILAASILTGITTAFCGPIAFVG